jgi:hypothetical protein
VVPEKNMKVGASYHVKIKKALMSAFFHQRRFFSAWDAIWTSPSLSRIVSSPSAPTLCSVLDRIGSCSEDSGRTLDRLAMGQRQTCPKRSSITQRVKNIIESMHLDLFLLLSVD